VVAALQIPWGNPSAGVIALRSVSRRAAARAACCLSARAWRDHWPEGRRRRGAEEPAAPGGVGAGALTVGVAGIGPGPVDHNGWSSARLVMRIR
jgi:hypothetical protein